MFAFEYLTHLPCFHLQVFKDDKEGEDGLIGFEDDEDVVEGSSVEDAESGEESDEDDDKSDEDDESSNEADDAVDLAFRSVVKAALGNAADDSDRVSKQ
jgi:hypothetical protein